MSHTSRREYLGRCQWRGPAQRGPLLEEFREVTGYERKYALKLLPGHRPGPASPCAGTPPPRKPPGWLQSDAVFHCGTGTRGRFVRSLVLVDTASQWNVLRATWNHRHRAIHSRIAEEEKRLSFPLLSLRPPGVFRI